MEMKESEVLAERSEVVGEQKIVSRSKYLIFKLGDERFGVTLSSVKEVIGLTKITEVPQVPKFFKGLINLRGRIISIMDLRLKLGLAESEYVPKKTSVIIAEIEDLVLGFIVDDVEQVANYTETQLEKNIDVQSNISKKYMQGVAKIDDSKLVLLIDIESIVGESDLEIIKNRIK